jgi:hypothetical protein
LQENPEEGFERLWMNSGKVDGKGAYLESKYLERSSLVLTTFIFRPSSFLSNPMARPNIWGR